MSRDGAAAARVAHNHEVRGSSPLPATKEKHPPKDGCFSLVLAARAGGGAERTGRREVSLLHVFNIHGIITINSAKNMSQITPREINDEGPSFLGSPQSSALDAYRHVAAAHPLVSDEESDILGA